MQIRPGVIRIENIGSQCGSVTNKLAVVYPGVPVDPGCPLISVCHPARVRHVEEKRVTVQGLLFAGASACCTLFLAR